MKEFTNEYFDLRGLLLHLPKQKDMDLLKELIKILPTYKCNTLVLLIRYRYAFKSHPEIADNEPITPSQVSEIVSLCHKNGIRIIPKMNLFGHQSEKERGTELGLLRAYPEFDETPELDTVKYCRSLCPRHPQVKDVVFDLIDEIIDIFQADAIHVGLDEVFEIGQCPRCKNSTNAELFAEWVNTLYDHIVKKNKVKMLMWGDRLLNGLVTGYGAYESSENDTYQAIDMIPNDIIICDWHYEMQDTYPSVPIFAEKNFKVILAPYKNIEATKSFINYADSKGFDNILGVLQTSWCDSEKIIQYLINNNFQHNDDAKLIGDSFKLSMKMSYNIHSKH